jgi:trimethylamine--corrinoid protein Co-methyltransferase
VHPVNTLYEKERDMYERMHILSQSDIAQIHSASMAILDDIGINFHYPEAIDIFRQHGFYVDGITVHLKESQIRAALNTAPAQFLVAARNPEKSVTIGGDHLVMAPGYGASIMITHDRKQREGLMDDYDNFCKLVQTSSAIDMNGCLMMNPSDRLPRYAHMDMLKSNLVLCDKPFIGSAVSLQAALDAIEMAGLAWGGKDQLSNTPVMISIISSMSPLQYSAEMTAALIAYARHGQVNMIGLLMMAGATGPVTLPGLLALQNAEMLAGVTLTQLVNPGAPVIYGGTSTVTDMRTGGLAIGAPELSMIQNATVQMGKYYGLPTRGSGGLSDAHYPDLQAGIESTLALTTTVMSGANFILHACGILGSYQSMSYEKFLADEEICNMLRRMLKPIDVSDDRLDLESIRSIGIGGEYLTHPKTLAHCRTEFYRSDVMCRDDFTTWQDKGSNILSERLQKMFERRMQAYIQPDIAPEIEKDLEKYIRDRVG